MNYKQTNHDIDYIFCTSIGLTNTDDLLDILVVKNKIFSAIIKLPFEVESTNVTNLINYIENRDTYNSSTEINNIRIFISESEYRYLVERIKLPVSLRNKFNGNYLRTSIPLVRNILKMKTLNNNNERYILALIILILYKLTENFSIIHYFLPLITNESANLNLGIIYEFQNLELYRYITNKLSNYDFYDDSICLSEIFSSDEIYRRSVFINNKNIIDSITNKTDFINSSRSQLKRKFVFVINLSNGIICNELDDIISINIIKDGDDVRDVTNQELMTVKDSTLNDKLITTYPNTLNEDESGLYGNDKTICTDISEIEQTDKNDDQFIKESELTHTEVLPIVKEHKINMIETFTQYEWLLKNRIIINADNIPTFNLFDLNKYSINDTKLIDNTTIDSYLATYLNIDNHKVNFIHKYFYDKYNK